jgi:hypothetical protein
MSYMDRQAFYSAYRTSGLVCVVVLLCVCVVAQMIGTPVTLLSLLDSDMRAESEPASEDPSALSPLPELGKPDLLRIRGEFRTIRHLPILITSVFHPPYLA